MPQITIGQTITAPGRSGRSVTIEVDDDNLLQSTPTVPAAKSGALTLRTSATVGTLTMAGGHGFNTGDKISLFWDTGSRHNVTVGTVATNEVPFSLGTGDNLPTLVGGTYAITAMVPHEEVFVATAANVDGIVCYSSKRGYITFAEAGGTVIKTIKIEEDGASYFWIDDAALANPVMVTTPLTANVGKILFSHDDSADTAEMEVSVVYN